MSHYELVQGARVWLHFSRSYQLSKIRLNKIKIFGVVIKDWCFQWNLTKDIEGGSEVYSWERRKFGHIWWCTEQCFQGVAALLGWLHEELHSTTGRSACTTSVSLIHTLCFRTLASYCLYSFFKEFKPLLFNLLFILHVVILSLATLSAFISLW